MKLLSILRITHAAGPSKAGPLMPSDSVKKMDPEILQTLQQIRNALYLLTAISGVTFLVWVIHWIGNIKVNFKQAWEDDFINLVDKYFERADFEKLAKHCNQKLAS
ncbi:MAG: hypothetical protein GY806_04570 [Gammaproteobacteria bacterium]|nr:hypothetical protein [Gammaproteobacteria bacterium]